MMDLLARSQHERTLANNHHKTEEKPKYVITVRVTVTVMGVTRILQGVLFLSGVKGQQVQGQPPMQGQGAAALCGVQGQHPWQGTGGWSPPTIFENTSEWKTKI